MRAYTASARERTDSGLRSPSGCSTSTMRTPGSPSDLRIALAMATKGVVQNRTASTPDRCNVTASWQLHDVHEPQSPLPTRTRVASALIRSTIPSSAACAALTFRYSFTVTPSKRAWR